MLNSTDNKRPSAVTLLKKRRRVKTCAPVLLNFITFNHCVENTKELFIPLNYVSKTTWLKASGVLCGVSFLCIYCIYKLIVILSQDANGHTQIHTIQTQYMSVTFHFKRNIKILTSN